MNCVARTHGMLAAAVLLGGCSYQPSLQHPKLPALVPIETTMDCRQIDHAIDRADTVRWVIRDDGGQLETSGEKAARYTGNFFLVPLTMLGGAPLYVRDGGHAVLNAADHDRTGDGRPGPAARAGDPAAAARRGPGRRGSAVQ